jgi:hypothetical protein
MSDAEHEKWGMGKVCTVGTYRVVLGSERIEEFLISRIVSRVI